MTTCDGSITAILTSRQCVIPLTVLRGPLFSLEYGDYIIAKVLFENEVGESSLSIENINPPMMQEVPNAPLVGPARIDAITIGTTMGVMFNAVTGADLRGGALVSYSLEIDETNAGAGPFDVVGTSLLTQYTIPSLTSGLPYYFRYRV